MLPVLLLLQPLDHRPQLLSRQRRVRPLHDEWSRPPPCRCHRHGHLVDLDRHHAHHDHRDRQCGVSSSQPVVPQHPAAVRPALCCCCDGCRSHLDPRRHHRRVHGNPRRRRRPRCHGRHCRCQPPKHCCPSCHCWVDRPLQAPLVAPPQLAWQLQGLGQELHMAASRHHSQRCWRHQPHLHLPLGPAMQQTAAQVREPLRRLLRLRCSICLTHHAWACRHPPWHLGQPQSVATKQVRWSSLGGCASMGWALSVRVHVYEHEGGSARPACCPTCHAHAVRATQSPLSMRMVVPTASNPPECTSTASIPVVLRKLHIRSRTLHGVCCMCCLCKLQE